MPPTTIAETAMEDQTSTQPHEQLAEPDPAQRPARLALYLGAGLLITGAVVLYLGYNGAATNPIAEAQLPYVISGGLLGVALMVLGGIAAAVHVLLQVQADFRKELNTMRESMEQLSEAMSHQMFDGSAPSTNGHSIVLVTRGASSFHREDCRLVQRAEHVKPLPRDEADRSGLTPCRICKP